MGMAITLPLQVFTQRNFVAEFIRFKLIFIHKDDKFASIAASHGKNETSKHLCLTFKLFSLLNEYVAMVLNTWQVVRTNTALTVR